MNNFATNLKYLRKEKKLSQQEISDKIGINQRTYSNYETGATEPTLDALYKLARFFRVSLDVLVGFSLDIALNKEDRALSKNLAEKMNVGNAELAGELFLQGVDVGITTVTGREPQPRRKLKKAIE